MAAYLVQDRIEAQNWTRHYQQIAREELGLVDPDTIILDPNR